MNLPPRSAQHNDLEAATTQSAAERLVLVPLGAVAIVAEGLIGRLASFSSRDGAERQVRLFEARGKVELERIEQEIRRYRSNLTGGRDTRSEQMRVHLRNSVRDAASKGRNFASKICSEMPTNL